MLRPFPKDDQKFLIAFSFAGEQRDLIRDIATATEQLLGIGTVFYDEWYTPYLTSVDADLKLQQIYRDQCEIVVPCISGAYDGKIWTKVEWASIRERQNYLRAAGDGEVDRIFPMRVGAGKVDGLLEGTTIWFDATAWSPAKVAESLLSRARQFCPDAGRLTVYLAQTLDLEDENERIVSRPNLARFLEEICDCRVIPKADQSDLIDQPTLEQAIQESDVFVQLLSKTFWNPVRFDQHQFDAARLANRPLYCFLGDLKTEQVKDAGHKQFLESTNGIQGQYQDFKRHLQDKLRERLEARRSAIKKLQDADAASGSKDSEKTEMPSVRVAIKAGESQSIWTQVYRFLKKKHDILLDELGPDQSFVTRQSSDPCHGFLILCDERALRSDSLSPTNALQQCRQIQIDFKGKQVPPVAVVFRTPPTLEEEEVIRCTPKCLSFVLDEDLEAGLATFIQQVRDVRKAMS